MQNEIVNVPHCRDASDDHAAIVREPEVVAALIEATLESMLDKEWQDCDVNVLQALHNELLLIRERRLAANRGR